MVGQVIFYPKIEVRRLVGECLTSLFEMRRLLGTELGLFTGRTSSRLFLALRFLRLFRFTNSVEDS